MLKNIIRVLVLLIILAIILLSFLYIDDYLKKEDNLSTIISEVDLSFIDKYHLLENVVQIDEENYLLFSRERAVDDEENLTGGLTYNYILYKYNMNTGVSSNSVQLDKGFEYNGINKMDKVIWLTLVDYENYQQEREYTEVWEINYDTMNVQNKFNNTEEAYNLHISSNGNSIVYSKEEGLYISDTNFNNTKLLMNNIQDEKDYINAKLFVPYEYMQDKIAYAKLGYEWVEGIGIYDVDNNKEYFFNQMNADYLGYKDNYMYYTEQYEPNNIYKVNLGTLQNETIFSIPSEDGYLDKRIYLSDDMKYVFITQNKYVQSDVEVLLQLYDLNTGNLVAKHVLPFEEYANIDNAFFVKDGIIFTKLYEMYKWNYLKSKGE